MPQVILLHASHKKHTRTTNGEMNNAYITHMRSGWKSMRNAVTTQTGLSNDFGYRIFVWISYHFQWM